MTYDDVMKLYLEHAEADEDHQCPERNEDFGFCEICERARQAGDRLMFAWRDLVMLLEQEHAIRQQLTFRVIQDVAPETRTPELQEVVLDSVHLGTFQSR